MRNRFARKGVHFVSGARAIAPQELTPALAALCSPIAAIAFALGLWALGSQIAIAANFPIASGALADWRVWLLLAGAFEFAALRFRSQNPDR